MAITGPLPICTVGATFGEGPVWIPEEEALWFVDIKQKRVYRFRPGATTLDHWEAPAEIGWVLPLEEGGFLAGLQTGLHLFDPQTGFSAYQKVEEHLPGNRLNDAATDAEGRLWFGSMDNGETEQSGSLYCLSGRGLEKCEVPPVSITNGPTISPDGRTVYHIDTLGKTIFAHDLDSDGRPGPGRPIVQLEEGDGYPDGAICDAEGNIWVGLFGGWSARLYSPEGHLLETVPFPVANVTKIALGGDDGRTAFATTARKGLSDAELADQPFAGDVFSFRVETPGVPVTRIRLPR